MARLALKEGKLMKEPKPWKTDTADGLEFNYCFSNYEECDKTYALSKCRAIRDLNKCVERPEGCRFRQRRFRDEGGEKRKKCCLLLLALV